MYTLSKQFTRINLERRRMLLIQRDLADLHIPVDLADVAVSGNWDSLLTRYKWVKHQYKVLNSMAPTLTCPRMKALLKEFCAKATDLYFKDQEKEGIKVPELILHSNGSWIKLTNVRQIQYKKKTKIICDLITPVTFRTTTVEIGFHVFVAKFNLRTPSFKHSIE